MQKITGIILTKPKLDNQRTCFFLKVAGEKKIQCYSGPGISCSPLFTGQKVSLIGDWPREITTGGDAPFFSFSEIEN